MTATKTLPAAPSKLIQRGAELRLRATGETVFVVGTPDSDPRCAVWVCFADDPDRAAWPMRSELAPKG